jgi:hypothetical protein
MALPSHIRPIRLLVMIQMTLTAMEQTKETNQTMMIMTS